MTTGTSAAKVAVNGHVSCLLLKVKRCWQIFVHTSREDTWELGFLTPHTCAVGYCQAGSVFVLIMGEEGEQGKAFIACGL